MSCATWSEAYRPHGRGFLGLITYQALTNYEYTRICCVMAPLFNSSLLLKLIADYISFFTSNSMTNLKLLRNYFRFYLIYALTFTILVCISKTKILCNSFQILSAVLNGNIKKVSKTIFSHLRGFLHLRHIVQPYIIMIQCSENESKLSYMQTVLPQNNIHPKSSIYRDMSI